MPILWFALVGYQYIKLILFVQLNSIDDPLGPGITITQHTYDHDRQFYIASLAEDLVVGEQYVLSMEFEGYLNAHLAGFYRSSYTDINGTTK